MSLISRAADTYYTFRFLRILTRKWEEMEAFEHGIIDKDGKNLRPARSLRTPAERASYTLFHRLVFNLKRLLEKLPFGRSRLASYAAGLFLLREHTNMTDEQIEKVLTKMGLDVESMMMSEETNTKNLYIEPGEYVLTSDIVSEKTGEPIHRAGTKVVVSEQTGNPVARVLGEPVYRIHHPSTNHYIFVSREDLEKS